MYNADHLMEKCCSYKVKAGRPTVTTLDWFTQTVLPLLYSRGRCASEPWRHSDQCTETSWWAPKFPFWSLFRVSLDCRSSARTNHLCFSINAGKETVKLPTGGCVAAGGCHGNSLSTARIRNQINTAGREVAALPFCSLPVASRQNTWGRGRLRTERRQYSQAEKTKTWRNKIQHKKLKGETWLNNRHTSEILKAVAGGFKHLPVEVHLYLLASAATFWQLNLLFLKPRWGTLWMGEPWRSMKA